ncbi:hypothetical protein D3C71_1193720 [compost metagenome]
MEKLKYVIMLLLISVFLSSCGGTRGSNSIVLKFRDELTVDRLSNLSGKTVSMTGFMATQSPLNGKYIYLMNMPYQSCPFCVPNSNQLANTLAVYAKEGGVFEFTDAPVKVTGTFELGDFTDALGYRYGYRVKNATYEKADLAELTEDIKVYTALIDKGFGLKFIELLNNMYAILGAKDFTTIEPIDVSAVTNLSDMFEGLDKSLYSEPIAVVAKVEKAVKGINSLLEQKDYATLQIYFAETTSIYEQLNAWLIKPDL